MSRRKQQAQRDTISIQSAAKNSFVVDVVDYIDPTVGDPGNLWTSS